MTDEDRIQHFDRVFIELIGGEDVWQRVVDHFNGHSYRAIGEMHSMCYQTARREIMAAKAAMFRAGLDVWAMEASSRAATKSQEGVPAGPSAA